ncbi:hypothetical protein [Asticcacaulis sp. AC402]|uniref:hypothetical protein n=1 Tax=Asticcacaulis sp. AC402 TaxID=1282361 RepID=UPI0003C3CF73|nr:hypothetical protein [Asticcacaulis sp. AC402]ESQ76686.1 hypothetical protein ABAC402_03145 [Asticcacaulis sp. AC402]
MTKAPLTRYLTGMSFWMVLYMAAIVFNGFYFRSTSPLGVPQAPWLYVFAVMPSLPVGGMIWVMLRHIEDSDEYVRGQLVRRYLIATGLTLLLCSAYTFLENYADVKIFERLYVFAVFCACLAVVTPFTLGATRNPS